MGRGEADAVAGAPQADGVLPKSKTSGGAARSGEFAQVRRQGRWSGPFGSRMKL